MFNEKTIRLIFVLIFLIIILPDCTNQPSESDEKSGNKFHKGFWIKSEYALGQDYYINVLLPRSYFTSDKTYPVLYFTDADWLLGVAETMALHLEMNKTEIILVGIGYGILEDTWEKRTKDFFANDFDEEGNPGYALFLSFFKKELIPKIESELRADPLNRTLFGWSAGFYFACHTLYEQRSLFANYILGGGLFPIDWANELKLGDRAKLREPKTKQPICIYVANPEYDVPVDKFKESIKLLKQQDFGDLFIKSDILYGHNHSIPAVIELIVQGMEYIYNTDLIQDMLLNSILKKGFKAGIQDFERWKQLRPDLGFYNSQDLMAIAEKLKEMNKSEEYTFILEYVINNYPYRKINFEVTSKSLPEFSTIYITGNHNKLGNWNLAEVALVKNENEQWNISFQIEQETVLEYKFNLGSWETEALNKEGNIPSNSILEVKNDTTIKILIPDWKGID